MREERARLGSFTGALPSVVRNTESKMSRRQPGGHGVSSPESQTAAGISALHFLKLPLLGHSPATLHFSELISKTLGDESSATFSMEIFPSFLPSFLPIFLSFFFTIQHQTFP